MCKMELSKNAAAPSRQARLGLMAEYIRIAILVIQQKGGLFNTKPLILIRFNSGILRLCSISTFAFFLFRWY